jgi:hypothetical protein
MERGGTLIEVSTDCADVSHFYIDAASFSGVLNSVGVAALLLVLSVYAAFHSPSLFNNQRTFFGMKRLRVNGSISLDIVISKLLPLHRFIAVNCSFVAKSAGRTFALPVNVTVRWLTNHMNESRTEPTVSRQIEFLSCCRLSRAFNVIHISIIDFGKVDLQVLLQGDFRAVDGFDIQWKFANVNVAKYQKSVHYLLSFVMAYMLAIFAIHFDGQFSLMESVIAVVGIAGVLSSNPFGLFSFSFARGSLADDVLVSFFASTYRMFLVLELQTLRIRRNDPHWVLVVVFAAFFSVYARCIAAATNARRTHMNKAESEVAVILHSEGSLIRIHTVYLSVLFVYLLVAAAMNGGQNVRRVWFATISSVVTGAATGVTQIVLVRAKLWMYSIVPELLFRSVYVVMAGLTLFLFHSAGEREYGMIDATEGSISLGPDRVTGARETGGLHTITSVDVC